MNTPPGARKVGTVADGASRASMAARDVNSALMAGRPPHQVGGGELMVVSRRGPARRTHVHALPVRDGGRGAPTPVDGEGLDDLPAPRRLVSLRRAGKTVFPRYRSDGGPVGSIIPAVKRSDPETLVDKVYDLGIHVEQAGRRRAQLRSNGAELTQAVGPSTTVLATLPLRRRRAACSRGRRRLKLHETEDQLPRARRRTWSRRRKP